MSPSASKIQPRRAASAASNAKGYNLSESNSSEDEEAVSPPSRRPAQPGQRIAHKPSAIVAASRRRGAVESRAPTRKPQRSKYTQSSGDESSNSDDDSRRCLIFSLLKC